MRLRRRWRILGLFALILGASYGLLWWANQRLTPLEQSLVGRWYWLAPIKPSGYFLVLSEYGADRTVQVGYFDGLSGELKDRYKRVGRWRIEGDLLICDWERRAGHRITRSLPFGREWAERWLLGWERGHGGLEGLRILLRTDDEIHLRAHDKTITFKRYTGELQLPPRTLPLDP